MHRRPGGSAENPASPASTAGVRSVTVSWKAPTGPVARYLVHMVGAGNTTCASSPCTIIGLAAGHPYAFSVAAVGLTGKTGPYTPATATRSFPARRRPAAAPCRPDRDSRRAQRDRELEGADRTGRALPRTHGRRRQHDLRQEPLHDHRSRRRPPYAFSVAAVAANGRTGPYSANSRHRRAVGARARQPDRSDTRRTRAALRRPQQARPGRRMGPSGPSHSHHVLYAAGDFTSIRPPGAKAGTSETPMPGSRRSTPTVPRQAPPARRRTRPRHRCLGRPGHRRPGMGPEHLPRRQHTLYWLGRRLPVRRRRASKAAAFDLTAPGGLVLPWNPQISGGSVRAITSTASTIYVGGAFTTVAGNARPQNAAFDAGSYAWIPGFGATVDGSIYALLAGPGNRLVLGGHFRTVNGAAHSGIAQVDLTADDEQPDVERGTCHGNQRRPSTRPGHTDHRRHIRLRRCRRDRPWCLRRPGLRRPEHRQHRVEGQLPRRHPGAGPDRQRPLRRLALARLLERAQRRLPQSRTTTGPTPGTT